MPGMELFYVLVAVGLGVVLYRYFSGHGGVRISRAELGDLPPEGELVVRRHHVRWTSAEDGSFAAVWQLASGRWVGMRIVFDAAEDAVGDEADQGRLDLTIDELEKITINAMKSAFSHYGERCRIIFDVLKPRFAALRNGGRD